MMDKGSFLWLLAIAGITAIAAYNSLFPLPSYIGFTRALALSGFMLLCVSLMLGPLAVIAPQQFAALLAHRRAIGLASFAMAFAHSIISFFFQFNLDIMAVLAGPSGPLAAAALVLFVALAATSTDWAVKRLMGTWKSIQRAAYIAFALSFVHFIVKSNGLFAGIGGSTFVNVSEVAMVILGVATVALQIYGFLTVRARKAAASAPPAQQAGQN
jgi:DMSO/TMAO reductase YedYZ heme-binding membrane subunit